jgi:hypothetical protein
MSPCLTFASNVSFVVSTLFAAPEMLVNSKAFVVKDVLPLSC